MKAKQLPNLGRGVAVASIGETPTEDVSPHIAERKKRKLSIAEVFEGAAPRVSKSQKRDRAGYRDTDSHDRPQAVIRAKLFPEPRATKAGVLGDSSLTAPWTHDARRTEVVPDAPDISAIEQDLITRDDVHGRTLPVAKSAATPS